jgi:hypothetical protein
MKTFGHRPAFDAAADEPCHGCVAGPGAPWLGLVLPDVPSVEPPGAHLLEQTVESVVREALSLGLTLHEAQQHLRLALAAVGLTLSCEELAEQVGSRARAYS